MIYGYTRVSTKKQVDGFGLEVQKNEIKNKYTTAIIIEEQYTGTKLDRPLFKDLLSKLQADDILVVSKLDRFARNTVEGIKVFAQNSSISLAHTGFTPASLNPKSIPPIPANRLPSFSFAIIIIPSFIKKSIFL